MNLKAKMEEALKKKKRIREANKYDYETQPNLYELNNFLKKSGYRLVDVVSHKDVDIPELLIEAIKPSYFYPEITHDVVEGEFYVNVVKYGNLVASDLEGIMEGYSTALGVLRHLESIDLNDLEYDKED